MKMDLRSATLDDLHGICALLTSAQLPTVGVEAHIREFIVAERKTEPLRSDLIAAIGIERYGDAALLRSMVVHEAARGTGLGTRLVHALEAQAKQRDVRTLLLLTTTADRWFATLGYEHIARDVVPSALLESAEFRGACPASALLMRKLL